MRLILSALYICLLGVPTFSFAEHNQEQHIVAARRMRCPHRCVCRKQPGGTCPARGPCAENCPCRRRKMVSNSMSEAVPTFKVHPGNKVFATGYLHSRTRLEAGDYDSFLQKLDLATPDVLDYRTKHLSQVVDQGNCGSCYSQATTSQISDVLILKGPKYPGFLSAEYFKNCGTKVGALGCSGGFFEVLNLAITPLGVPLLKDLPYVAQNKPCAAVHGTKGSILKWFYAGSQGVAPSDEELIKGLNLYGPASVTIYANQTLMNYHSGIVNQCSKGDENHMVELVGYERKANAFADSLGNYGYGDVVWIFKNSWGPDYGEKGYVRIVARDSRGRKCNNFANHAAFIQTL